MNEESQKTKNLQSVEKQEWLWGVKKVWNVVVKWCVSIFFGIPIISFIWQTFIANLIGNTQKNTEQEALINQETKKREETLSLHIEHAQINPKDNKLTAWIKNNWPKQAFSTTNWWMIDYHPILKSADNQDILIDWEPLPNIPPGETVTIQWNSKTPLHDQGNINLVIRAKDNTNGNIILQQETKDIDVYELSTPKLENASIIIVDATFRDCVHEKEPCDYIVVDSFKRLLMGYRAKVVISQPIGWVYRDKTKWIYTFSNYNHSKETIEYINMLLVEHFPQFIWKVINLPIHNLKNPHKEYSDLIYSLWDCAFNCNYNNWKIDTLLRTKHNPLFWTRMIDDNPDAIFIVIPALF